MSTGTKKRLIARDKCRRNPAAMILLMMFGSSVPPGGIVAQRNHAGILQNPDGQSPINPAALTRDLKLELAAINAELALLPSEAVDGSSPSGLAGDEDISSTLVSQATRFPLSGTVGRLANLQPRQQHLIELENQAGNWSGFNEPSPYPFLRADELKVSACDDAQSSSG